MKSSKERGRVSPWPEDFDAASNERDRVLNRRGDPQQKHSLRTQLVTSLKLLAVTASLGLVLWFLDQMVTGS
ncbi:MAG: hypothetical protein U0Q18_17535 [Bryobacteraceae bacterium]